MAVEFSYELGIAFSTTILGLVLLGFYRTGLADTAPADLPGGVLEAAQETLAGALLYARELPGELGEALWPRPPPTRSRPRSRRPEGSPR